MSFRIELAQKKVVFLAIIEEDNLMSNAVAIGDFIRSELRSRLAGNAGVIEVADRRRARVAAAGAAAARRMLGGHPALSLAGSDDPGLDLALRA